MTAEEELERLEREITSDKENFPRAKSCLLLRSAKDANPRHGFDFILAMAALAIIGFAVNTVRKMPDQQANIMRDGLIASAAGLLVGYAVDRIRS
jgi:hypothetical protein